MSASPMAKRIGAAPELGWMNLRPRDFDEVDDHVGGQQGVVWRSACAPRLDLHNQKHWIGETLVTGRFEHAIHILLNACWCPNRLKCVEVAVHRIGSVAAIPDSEVRVGDMELAPP